MLKTRDYCRAACVGGLVTLCETSKANGVPNSVFADYTYSGARVTCKGALYNAWPPPLATYMEREPTPLEFPPTYEERLANWRSQSIPRFFSWSNSLDLNRFLTNSRWRGQDGEKTQGGVVGIVSLDPPPHTNFYINDSQYRDALDCLAGYLPFTGVVCNRHDELNSNLIKLLRGVDIGACDIGAATSVNAMASTRATLFTCKNKFNSGIECDGNDGSGLFFAESPGTSLILSTNEQIVCSGKGGKGGVNEAIVEAVSDPLEDKTYLACEFGVSPISAIEYVTNHGIATGLNFNLISPSRNEDIPMYAFASYSNDADYVPTALPETYTCASQIASRRKESTKNTVVVTDGSLEVATNQSATEIQKEVLYHGPLTAQFWALPSFDTLKANDIYHNVASSDSRRLVDVTILGWGKCQDVGPRQNETCWIVMSNSPYWANNNIGLLDWNTTAAFTTYAAESKWSAAV